RQQAKLARGTEDEEHAMSPTLNAGIAVIGIDIGKNSFHIVGLDRRGAIVLRQKWSTSCAGSVILHTCRITYSLSTRLRSPKNIPAVFPMRALSSAELVSKSSRVWR